MHLASARSFVHAAVLLASIVCPLAACGDARNPDAPREASASTAKAPPAQRDTVPCTEQALLEHVAAARPPRASMAGGRVSLVPPEGLPLVDYPNLKERGLTFMVDPGTSIIVSLFDDSVDAAEMERLTAPLFGEAVKSRRRAEPVDLGGVRWERLGFTGDIVGMEQRTEIYITPFQGQTLIVNATVIPSSEEARWRPRMEASIATLEVRNCRLTDSVPSS